MDLKEASNLFKMLGDENRLKIVKILVNTDEVCACKFLNCVDCGQSTLSFHLQILKDNKIVNCRKDGKKMLYSINKDKINDLMKFVYNTCEDFKYELFNCE